VYQALPAYFPDFEAGHPLQQHFLSIHSALHLILRFPLQFEKLPRFALLLIPAFPPQALLYYCSILPVHPLNPVLFLQTVHRLHPELFDLQHLTFPD